MTDGDDERVKDAVDQFLSAGELARRAMGAMHAAGVAPNALSMIILAVSIANSVPGEPLPREVWLRLCADVYDAQRRGAAPRRAE